MKAIVFEKGQVTIPKAVRSKLGIKPGTVLDFSAEEGRLVAVKEQQQDAFARWRGKGRLPGGMTVDEYLATADTLYAEKSEGALRRASLQGQLIVCEAAIAEIVPALGDRERVHEILVEWQIDFLPSDEESALLAAEMLLRYLKRGREQKRIPADFLIGAHASVHADRLLARDRGYLRDYFSSLNVVDPTTLR